MELAIASGCGLSSCGLVVKLAFQFAGLDLPRPLFALTPGSGFQLGQGLAVGGQARRLQLELVDGQQAI